MRAFTATGFWHLPSDPANKVAGTLEYSATKGARVALTGSFAQGLAPLRAEGYPLIHGIVAESPVGKFFTLVDCIQTQARLSIPGFATESLHASQAFAGDHLFDQARPEFTGVRVQFSELGNWVGYPKTLQHEFKKDDGRIVGGDVSYRHPEPISVTLEGAELHIRSDYNISESRANSITLKEEVWVHVAMRSGRRVEQINAAYVRPLQNFLTLAADAPAGVDAFIVLREDLKRPHREIPAQTHVLRQPVFVPDESSAARWPHDMLFTLEDVREGLGDLLMKWMSLHHSAPAFCNIYFSLQEAPPEFIDVKFLWLAQVLSLYFAHRGQAPSVYERLRTEMESLLSKTVPEGERGWAHAALPTEGDLCWGRAVFDAINESQQLMGPLVGSDARAFVDRAVKTRRYLLHRDEALRSTAADGAELHWLIEKLTVLVKVALLRELNLDSPTISRFFNRNRRYMHLKTV